MGRCGDRGGWETRAEGTVDDPSGGGRDERSIERLAGVPGFARVPKQSGGLVVDPVRRHGGEGEGRDAGDRFGFVRGVDGFRVDTERINRARISRRTLSKNQTHET